MRIKCPQCLAVYDVPDKALPEDEREDKSQKMRCFKCKAIFSVMLRQSMPSEPPLEIEKSDLSGADSDIVSRPSEWTEKKTLDLGGFSSKGEMPIRKFFLISLVAAFTLIVLFFVFVAARNDWVLSFPNLSEQIGIAFWGDAAKHPPEAIKDLEVTVSEGYQVVSRDGSPVLVVTGKISNPSGQLRTDVILHGRIVGQDGKVKFETRAPCGKVFKKSRLGKVKKDNYFDLYSRKGKLYNCRVKAESKRKFMLIFNNMPPDYHQKYTVEVSVMQARTPDL